MSTLDTATHESTIATTQPLDPYPYGWRYVQRTLPNGVVVSDRVALTLEDVLHPQEGDQVTHSDLHQRICTYLYNVFCALLALNQGAVVLNDVRVAWDTPDIKPHRPDLAVIFGVRERKNWSIFDSAEEGVRPTIIVEVTSPETRNTDLIDKLEEYDLAGVPIYIIIDLVQRKNQVIHRLLGYQQTEMAYEMMLPDPQRRLWIEPLNIWLGVNDQGVICYNADNTPVGDYTKVQQELTAAEQRIKELEAELRKLRGEA
ncbi:MAG: Uma2 family endonuclease [Roseiflexaceae bacterium]|nr:Uma2 family endonuclease [Roseiflexaceae bacterium]